MEPSQYLNDIENEKIRQFVNDKLMYNAVKKVLLAGIYSNGVLKAGEPHDPAINFALSSVFAGQNKTNEQLGEILRAQAEGIRTVEGAFAKLEELGTPPADSTAEKNPAR